MKSRASFLLALGLIILISGVALYTFAVRDQLPSQVFPATIQRDCAPWDGAAFTVQILLNHGTIIDISVWQSPEINLPKTFFFPDNSGQVGDAILIHPVGNPDPLTGTVFFRQVNQKSPVTGAFELSTENGKLFKGQFTAEWNDIVALCG